MQAGPYRYESIAALHPPPSYGPEVATPPNPTVGRTVGATTSPPPNHSTRALHVLPPVSGVVVPHHLPHAAPLPPPSVRRTHKARSQFHRQGVQQTHSARIPLHAQPRGQLSTPTRLSASGCAQKHAFRAQLWTSHTTQKGSTTHRRCSYRNSLASTTLAAPCPFTAPCPATAGMRLALCARTPTARLCHAIRRVQTLPRSHLKPPGCAARLLPHHSCSAAEAFGRSDSPQLVQTALWYTLRPPVTHRRSITNTAKP